jgi:hypothetical protein
MMIIAAVIMAVKLVRSADNGTVMELLGNVFVILAMMFLGRAYF